MLRKLIAKKVGSDEFVYHPKFIKSVYHGHSASYTHDSLYCTPRSREAVNTAYAVIFILRTKLRAERVVLGLFAAFYSAPALRP